MLTSFTYFFLLLLFSFSFCSNIHVWGPGLSPNKIVLPARYFFIRLHDNASTDSILNLKNDISVNISGESQLGHCRMWVEKLDRKDGSLILRYRLYETCYNFQIDILYKNKYIANSPLKFAGLIHHEGCYCPVSNFSEWMHNNECPHEIEQIKSDLMHFKNVNMTLVFDEVLRRFDRPGSVSLCYYVIKNNELYRKCFGNHVGFHIFSDAILLSVIRKVVVPDQSFFINLGDWPLVRKNSAPIVPVFSWCGSDDTYDIVLPTYDLTESTLGNMERVMLDMLSVQGNINKKWNEKIQQAFWRGRDSRIERLKLIDIARKNPSLYNVSLTNFFFSKDAEKTHGPKSKLISFFKFFDYKYQITIDGTVAAYRTPYLLAGDSLVLKQESPFYEHFYHQLQPNVHYVPIKRDLSDLTEKLLWAMNNDEKANKIAKKGQEFARNFLMPKDIICYYALALNEWSKHIVSPPEIIDGMEKVNHDEKQLEKCHCTENNYFTVKNEL